ncbi:MAG: PAS domain-containing protein [Scytonema sp. CRU_2_7]|nr:PAS domain-containing protein [Scytonema sp. CRU_2_7]
MNHVLANHVTQEYAIAVFDGEQEIYRRYDNSDVSHQLQTKWGREKELNLYGVSWRVRVWATEALLAQEQSLLPTVVLCSGLAVAVLLALSVSLTQAALRYARQVKIVNQELAQEITERKQAEIALRESEQRYATLAEASPVSIFRTDESGHCLYVNSRWSEMTGLTSAEAIGEGWTRTLHPQDRDRVFAEWYQAAQANVPFGCEYRFMHDDGVVTWVFGQAVVEKNPNGEVIGYIGTLTDITAHKQAESALQESEERWQLAVRGSNDAIWDWNIKTSQVFFSSRWKEMRGFAEHEIGHSVEEWSKRIHPDDIDWIMQAVEDHFAKKRHFLPPSIECSARTALICGFQTGDLLCGMRRAMSCGWQVQKQILALASEQKKN